jgi:TPR repeat protein
MLGLCYYHGQGIEQNIIVGKIWLRSSAEQGYPLAIEMLKELENQ